MVLFIGTNALREASLCAVRGGGLSRVARYVLFFALMRRAHRPQSNRHAAERLPRRSVAMLALALGQFRAAGSLLEVFSVFAHLPLRPICRCCCHVVSQGCIRLHRQDEFADCGLEADLGRLLEAAQEWTFGHIFDGNPARFPSHQHLAPGLERRMALGKNGLDVPEFFAVRRWLCVAVVGC